MQPPYMVDVAVKPLVGHIASGGVSRVSLLAIPAAAGPIWELLNLSVHSLRRQYQQQNAHRWQKGK